MAAGKNKSRRITDINRLKVTLDSDDYANWSDLESHLGPDALDFILA